ncbi:hypothetical protein C8Q74DRAFT_1373099 [Fomes fomentarius]|nr:hypothetical protein C8Q74DRAFT_1373099 [Fomes fomentarius]
MSDPVQKIAHNDSRVIYSGNWISGAAISTHEAQGAGLTATLRFTGTRIQVYGPLAESRFNGQPATRFDIDGEEAGTYSAPWTDVVTLDVRYFVKDHLFPGSHTVKITTLNPTNGTSLTAFLLEYFLVDNGTSSSSESATSTITRSSPVKSTTSVTSPAITSGTSLSSESATSTVTTAQSSTVASSASVTPPAITSALPSVTSWGQSRTGAIVGSVVGFVAILILIVWYLRVRSRRRRRYSTSPVHLEEYSYSPPEDFHSPHTRATTLIPNRLSPVLANTTEKRSLVPHRSSTVSTTAAVYSEPPSSVLGRPAPGEARRVRSSKPQDAPILATHPDQNAPDIPSPPSAPNALLQADVAQTRWFAPVELQARGRALLQAFVAPNRRGSAQPPRALDSGLRVYDEDTLPPAYTPN